MKSEKKDKQAAAEARETATPAEDPASTEATPETAQAAETGAGDAAAEPKSDAGAELDTVRDRYLRLAAEYDNYRKRTERERGESWVRAQAQLVEKLLEPLDDLQRVAHFGADTVTVESLREGVQMVERKLLRVLESAGLEKVEARGRPFDPALHEALMTTEAASEEEDDVVAEEFQAGYQFGGVLLRPARVQVKKYHG